MILSLSWLRGGPSSRVSDRQVLMCFFFRAEDGIRVGTVTGVQTCALPISSLAGAFASSAWIRGVTASGDTTAQRAGSASNPVGIGRRLTTPHMKPSLKFSDCACLVFRSEEHTSELQSQFHLVCRLLLEKKK